MKKTVSLFLFAVLLLSLLSCGKDNVYPPVESSELEATVLLRFGGEAGSYDLRYELYRALYLSAIDEAAGDTEKADLLVRERAAEIFAIFDLCREFGKSLDGADIESMVDEYIKASVEGGIVDGNLTEGFDSYEDYLASLAAIHLTYEAQRLLFKYMIGIDLVEEHYAGSFLTGTDTAEEFFGELEITEANVRAFYESDDCVRVIRGYFPETVYSDTRVAEMREEIANKSTEEDRVFYIIAHTTASGSDVENGLTIGRHSLDSRYYKELTSAAFALKNGEVSDVIRVSTGEEDGSFVLVGAKKSDEHFLRCYDEITVVYAEEEIGKILAARMEKLLGNVTETGAYQTLDHASIGKEAE